MSKVISNPIINLLYNFVVMSSSIMSLKKWRVWWGNETKLSTELIGNNGISGF